MEGRKKGSKKVREQGKMEGGREAGKLSPLLLIMLYKVVLPFKFEDLNHSNGGDLNHSNES